MSNEDIPRHRPWEEDYGPEEELLYTYGFHRVRGLEDMWQWGTPGNPVREPEMYTR